MSVDKAFSTLWNCASMILSMMLESAASYLLLRMKVGDDWQRLGHLSRSYFSAVYHSIHSRASQNGNDFKLRVTFTQSIFLLGDVRAFFDFVFFGSLGTTFSLWLLSSYCLDSKSPLLLPDFMSCFHVKTVPYDMPLPVKCLFGCAFDSWIAQHIVLSIPSKSIAAKCEAPS